MKKVFSSILIMATLVTLIGCNTVQLTAMQKRQITTKMMDGNYENIFKATVTVLQDNEYIIKDSKLDTGLITAEVNKESDWLTKALTTSKYGGTSMAGTKVEISAVVDKINTGNSEIRISIEEKVYSNQGGTTSSTQNLDPKVYAKLFGDIQVEIKRREALRG